MTGRTGLTRPRQARRSPLLLVLLGVVAAAAAVLSFSALRDLALLCGFTPGLAWLLPVVADAGAAAGSLVWLGGRAVAETGRRFARVLALGLLALSVAANALGHWLEAFHRAPAWWVVVAVSAIAPAVLGAVVHLAVLAGRPHDERGAEPAVEPELAVPGDPGWSEAWPDDPTPPGAAPPEIGPGDRATELIAAGMGRRRLSRELGISDYQARQLLRGPEDDSAPERERTAHTTTEDRPWTETTGTTGPERNGFGFDDGTGDRS